MNRLAFLGGSFFLWIGPCHCTIENYRVEAWGFCTNAFGRAMKNLDKLIKKLRQGDIRALARVLSLIEDWPPEAERCVELLYPHPGRIRALGITGTPGAGKSTLVDALIQELLKQGTKVAVLAVDPTSPFSGGAVLGDRIRMVQSARSQNVFIRSMATRGALGGLAPRTAEAVLAFDAAGYDWVLIETVGVGQAEVEIVKNSDTVVVVMVPGMGDGVQTLKAGIIEIADVFAINKADYQGVEQLERDLHSMLGLAKTARKPEIVKTVATQQVGSRELLEAVVKHQEWAKNSGENVRRREMLARDALERELAGQLLRQVVEFAEKNGHVAAALAAIRLRKQAPSLVARGIVEAFMQGKG
jgi:LAO/AO transport system kinase